MKIDSDACLLKRRRYLKLLKYELYKNRISAGSITTELWIYVNGAVDVCSTLSIRNGEVHTFSITQPDLSTYLGDIANPADPSYAEKMSGICDEIATLISNELEQCGSCKKWELKPNSCGDGKHTNRGRGQ